MTNKDTQDKTTTTTTRYQSKYEFHKPAGPIYTPNTHTHIPTHTHIYTHTHQHKSNTNTETQSPNL